VQAKRLEGWRDAGVGHRGVCQQGGGGHCQRRWCHTCQPTSHVSPHVQLASPLPSPYFNLSSAFVHLYECVQSAAKLPLFLPARLVRPALHEKALNCLCSAAWHMNVFTGPRMPLLEGFNPFHAGLSPLLARASCLERQHSTTK
jgi:hypothetical protein